jgi:drug/metabolite transporter (DMT)-like permease
MALVLSFVLVARAAPDPTGIGYAFLSGALTSGVGYAIWYAALPSLKSTTAATVQLSVPILAAAGGVFFLGEPLTLRLLIASVAILGGIALVVLMGARKEMRGPAPRRDLGTEPRS